MSNEINQKKRKRTKNTIAEQYEIYLECMENDYVFRSGTINPTMEPNYLEKKWENLVNQLNAVPDGPIMSVPEWQKRFLDWKYATRAKYRKIKEHRMKTGSGPPLDKSMTKIEERALAVWGAVVVTGNQEVTSYEGITTEEPSFVTPLAVSPPCTVIDLDNSSNNLLLPILIENNNQDKDKDDPNTSETNTKKTFTPKKKCSNRQKPLSILGEKLLKETKNNAEIISNFNEILQSSISQYIALEERRLNFEIAKYKFENPNFVFQ